LSDLAPTNFVDTRSVGARDHRAATDIVLSPDLAKVGQRTATTFLTIQALRGVAALLVGLVHVFEMWGLRVNPGAPGLSWGNGAAGVDIFFIISGFVMVVSSRRLAQLPRGWLTFLQHRVVRIVPLYWLVTTVKLIAVVVLADLVLRTSLNLGYVVSSYLLLPVVDAFGHFRPVVHVGWTLTYEFLFYLIFAAALAVRAKVLKVVLPTLILFALVGVARTETWPYWTVIFNTIVLEFGFGVILGKLVLQGRRLPPGISTFLVLAGFVLLLSVPSGSETLRFMTWGLPALAIVAGTVSLEPVIAKAVPRWLLEIGNASYSIYLTHGFVVPMIGIFIALMGWSGAMSQVLTVLVCLALSALVGWMVYLTVERPMLRALKR
jgi:exopolysaccharide production protein ExoZ